MRARVFVQTELSCEGFVAEGAAEGFLSSVHAHVRVQLMDASELAPTHGTAERFLSGVNEQVVLQVVRAQERFAALRTRVLLNFSVSGYGGNRPEQRGPVQVVVLQVLLQVLLQPQFPLEASITDGAEVVSAALVPRQVRLLFKRFLTNGTFKRAAKVRGQRRGRARVMAQAHVSRQVRLMFETFVTDGADVRPRARVDRKVAPQVRLTPKRFPADWAAERSRL